MQQSINSSQLKGRADGAFNIWGETGNTWENINKYKDFWPSAEEGKSDSTLEAGTGVSSTPNSISGSVITSSNLCGVQGTTISVNASTSEKVYNAHCGAQCSNASPHVTSHCSGSSMLCGSFPSQGDSQNSSNSQSAQSTTSESGTISGHPRRPKTEQRDSVMWSVATSGDGPQGSNTPMNQNTIGAKNALSEPHGLQQASTSQHSMNDHLPPHPDMQTNVHAVDPTQRYNDMATNHGTNGMGRNFPGGNGNGAYRNVGGSNGAHSNNPQLLQVGATAESNGSHNQNSTYGAQYNSSANRAKSQVTGCENNSCSNGSGASYSGWQGLNTSAASSSSNNGWNIPESSLTGRTGHGSQSNPTSSDNVNDDENMMVDSDMSYSGLIGATGGSDYTEEQQNSNNYREGSTWGMPPPPRMGLLGGGESSLNAGSTGWGGPGPSGASGSGWGGGGRQSGNGTATEMAGNPNAGMSPPKPHNSWAQAAGKGLNPPPQNNSANNGQNGNGQSESGNLSSSVPGSVTKVRIDEHVTELRIAAAFSDGWGQTPVNQDTPWDVPPATPEPNTSKENTTNAVWRAPVNNGTEIWENNLRLNKGVTTPITSANTPPWGHTPSTNIGGHWGDDDSSSNMWTGVPQNNTNNNASNWVDPNSNANASNMWGNPPPPPSEKHWGNQGGSSWGDNGTPDNGTSVWNPPVSKQRNVGSWSPVATPKKDIQPSGWEEPSPPTARRPMPNYDDGTAVWGNPSRQGKVSHWKDMPAAKPITNSGSNSGPLTTMPPVSIGGGGVPPAGPGMIRLPSGAAVNNKGEIASSVWGKQPQLNRNTSWTDMPSHRDSPNIGNWGEDPHMQNQMKSVPGTPSASSAAFGGGWGEQQPGPMPPPYWGAKPKGPANWAEGQVDTSTWGGPSKQRGDLMQEGWPAAEDMSGNMWCEGAKDSSIGYWNGENQNPAIPWVGRKLKGGKPLTRDLIWASKQFRLLLEMGVKKEDAENALRNNNMNLDDAIGELHSASRDNNMMDVDGYNGRKMRPGNVADEMAIPEHVLDPSYGPGNFHGAGAFQGPQILPGFAGAQGFKPQVKGSGLNSNTPSLLTNAALGGQASSLSSISSLSPALVQKILQQQQQQQAQPFATNNLPQNPLGNQGSRMGQNNFPSAAQLRHLVQQIQMAVQAGHLNPQILNQPLAPQTLQLLYQLLQQIKVLHQLQQQQIFQNQHLTKPGPGGPGNPSGLQLNVQITQTKQRIVNLQNQIAAQQALFLKQQLQHQPPQHPSLHTAQPSADIFKPNIDPMPALHTDFRELSLKDAALQTQSRLNQWKLPSYEKDENPLGSSSGSQGGNINANNNFNAEFSRAPGPLSSKPSSSASSAMPNSGPNLHPLLSQGESAWSSLSRAQGDSGWPDAATSSAGVNDNVSNANNISNTNNTSVATTVPNSGNSVQTSNSDIKEPSPTPPTSGPSTSSASHTSYLTDLVPEFEPGKPWKGTSQMKNVEDDPHITPGSIARSPLSLNTIKDSDLFNWNSKTSPATTGNDTLVSSLASLTSSTWVFTPPAVPNSSSVPCKSGNVKSSWGSLTADTAAGSDLWGSSITKARGPPPGLSGQGWDRQNSSNFLVLRNLTPQIDGSTLKTLCMQHGPLQLFHLFLNHGIALVRYSTREEAAKAQSALTNCVLGNTTILADIPSETEVQQYLVVANGQPAGGNMGWPTPPQGGNAATSFRANNASYPFGSSTGSTTNTGKLDSTSWNGNSLNMPTSQLWSFPSSGGGSLWASTQSINDHDQSTSSSLNSYLPGDLLNGEPM